MIDAEELITQYGWKFTTSCSCSGYFAKKYRNKDLPTLELQYWPGKQKFRVTYLGTSTKIPISSIIVLEETLKQLEDNV